jgi:exodeoxyribonuclease VII large subunit
MTHDANDDPTPLFPASRNKNTQASAASVSVRRFLDHVAAVLSGGLPERLWIEATIISVRASTYGHTLELSDAGPQKETSTLRVFLSKGALAIIQRDLGIPIDPLMLTGMTTALLVAPSFTPRWHLGGRVEGLAQAVATSLRQKILEQAVGRLKREGLWDRQRKLPRPQDVTTLAVVHPSGAAGWADIAGELELWQQAGILRVKSIPASFEGEASLVGLVRALEAAVLPIAGHLPDLVLIVRGGGARASLSAMDNEDLARAVCRCPIPIISGTGHAVDRTLVDDVAWRAVDTPSKALALVAEMIAVPARAAVADYANITAMASTAVERHASDLRHRREQLNADARAAISQASGTLDASWSKVHAGATIVRDRIDQLDAFGRQRAAEVCASASRLVDEQGQRSRAVFDKALHTAGTCLSQLDGGAKLMAYITARTTACFDNHSAALDRSLEAVLRHARACLDAADHGIERLHAEAEARDVDGLLRRGFAIVTDRAGRLVPTRDAASREGELNLLFADGVIRVTPTSPAQTQ